MIFSQKQFPILGMHRLDGFPDSVPWSFVAKHEKQAYRNHGQTLKELAQRGGLGWDELYFIVTDQEYPFFSKINEVELAKKVMKMIEEMDNEVERPLSE